MQQASRILIVRLSAIGDVVHGLPVLCALREALPHAYLGWVVERPAADLLVGHKALDRLVVVPRGWLKSPRYVVRLWRQLRAARFEVAIDLQGLSKSAIAARLSGAQRRIGIGGVDGREVSQYLNNELVVPSATHVVERNLELLRPLGIERPPVRFDIPLDDPDIALAEALVNYGRLEDGFAVLNPGAGWRSKLWPVERFAEVARYLGTQRNLPSVVVWAGEREHYWAEQIVENSAGQARLAPPTTLRQLAALMQRATLFVGSDTGPLHLAAAVGTPCVGLYGPVSAERNGPYGAGHRWVQRVTLTGGSRERRNAGPASMLAISVADVCNACDRVVGRHEAAA
jgi:lipopolysaccharide heptosyltransferase I